MNKADLGRPTNQSFSAKEVADCLLPALIRGAGHFAVRARTEVLLVDVQALDLLDVAKDTFLEAGHVRRSERRDLLDAYVDDACP